jgi:hypothetical protein
METIRGPLQNQMCAPEVSVVLPSAPLLREQAQSALRYRNDGAAN